jgi:DNA-binding response OmpR family regulator
MPMWHSRKIMCAHILVVEDDQIQADLVRRYLEHEGHFVVVEHNGSSALAEFRRREADLVVLDLMLPRLSGLEVCRALRAESDAPVIMLTARTTEDDVLAGLDVGADDYLTKPYRPRELVARIRAVLRRSGSHDDLDDGAVRVGDLVVDPTRHRVMLGNRQVNLTASEFRVLEVLAASPGKVFTRRNLLQSAFGYSHFVQDRTVDVHIKNLRRKIEDFPARPQYVRTVHGVGYLVDAPEEGSDEG